MNKALKVFFVLLFLLFEFHKAFANDLELSFVHLRRFDEIHVELWAKSLTQLPQSIGYGNLQLTYDTTFLLPQINPVLNTDSISANIDQLNPIITINSPIILNNGFVNPVILIKNSKVNFAFKISNSFQKGFKSDSLGKGTFLGIITFKILNNADYKSFSGIDWVKDSTKLFTTDSTDLSSVIKLKSELDYNVLGIRIISPYLKNTIIDRDRSYLSTVGAYSGFPVYIERSINPKDYSIPGDKPPAVDRDLGYELSYSTDAGNNWAEYGRFIESDVPGNSILDNGMYYTDEIYNPATSSSYITTNQSGSQINKTNFRKPLRILLKKDLFYKLRYDNLSIQLTKLNGTFGIPLSTWAKDSLTYIAPNTFITGRIFTLQLNGSNEYLKTIDNISNSTQLTVEAWVNVNTFKNGEPGIIASSAGEDAAPVLGSKEGAWILYLKDGKYPAFRVREIEARGKNGYLAQLVSHYPINSIESNKYLTHDFDMNWNFISATVKNNAVKLYVNGELVDEFVNDSSLDSRMLTTNHPVWIGVNPNDKIDASDYLAAAIKSVRVWKVALSQDEIRKNAAGIVEPTNVTGFNDLRRALELYYIFQTDIKDYASDSIYQHKAEQLEFFKAKTVNNDAVLYKPDNPHIKLTSPAIFSGLSNIIKSRYEIRWLSYELGNITKSNTQDIEFEYSLNGNLWTAVRDSNNKALVGLTALDAEKTTAIWEPYNNNDATANLRTIDPFSKNVLLRLKGTVANKQDDIYNISDTIKIAPYFSIKKNKASPILIFIPDSNGLNLNSSKNLIEFWLKPYLFPTESEDNIPIISKIDSVTGIELYSLRILSTGQIQLRITANDSIQKIAVSDIYKPLVLPNSIAVDTAWSHVAVYFDLKYKDSLTFIKFFIDGNPQNDSAIVFQVGKSFSPLKINKSCTYICSYPNVKSQKNTGFDGEIREIRFWENVPNNLNVSLSDYDELTKFIQGAQSVRSSKLNDTNRKNLFAAISFNGGTHHYKGMERTIASDDFPNFYVRFMNDEPEYIPVFPYIKLAEPVYKQRVTNKSEGLKIRWVGFDYLETDFPLGSNGVAPYLEYSLLGGGGSQSQPYQFVGSIYWSGNIKNSLTFPDSSSYKFYGTVSPVFFGGKLDVSYACPDVNKDGKYTDQGPLPATLTNARLRLSAKYKVFNTIRNIQTEGPLFSITPASNFTIRTLLEGYHHGKFDSTRNIPSEFQDGGIRLTIFEDDNGSPGKLVDSADSFYGYSDINPANLNAGNYKFANIDFVFNNLNKSNYWALVRQKNHLPVLSRFNAPCRFEGDDAKTWKIESGWDFLSWNGISDNVLNNSNTDPWIKNNFTAYGEAKSLKTETGYLTTALVYNNGRAGQITDAFPAMIGGDAVYDGKIDEVDAAYVRKCEASKELQGDITGDGFINSDDRIITDRNFGKSSSVVGLNLPTKIFINKEQKEEIVNGLDTTFLKDLKIEFRKENDKNDALKLLSDLNIKMSVNTIITNKILDLELYLENTGADFNLGSSTIAITYDTLVLSYRSFNSKADVPFNLSAYGYFPIRSAPAKDAVSPIKAMRTFEIDYNIKSGKSGSVLTKSKTYIGTLKFNILNNKVIRFNWHPSTSVHAVDGTLIDKDLEKDTILPIFQFTSTITSPNGGEEYRPSLPVNITWKYTGSGNINIEYSSNGGIQWQKINITPIINTLGKLSWTASAFLSNFYYIRITDADSGLELDRSDASFSVITGFAYIVRPAKDDAIYYGGTTASLIWVSSGFTYLNFDISTNGGENWGTLLKKVDAKKGETSWQVPLVTSKNAVIRMMDYSTGEEIVQSDYFKILSGTFEFTRPKPSEIVYINRTYNVRWTATDIDKFDLQVSYNGGDNWENLQVDADSRTGYFKWLIPDHSTSEAQLRAIWKGDPEMEYAVSPTFIITILDNVEYNDLQELGISIFPNPAKDYINIDFSKSNYNPRTIKLLNVEGKEIYKEQSLISKETKLDVKQFPSGKYNLIIELEKEYLLFPITIVK